MKILLRKLFSLLIIATLETWNELMKGIMHINVFFELLGPICSFIFEPLSFFVAIKRIRDSCFVFWWMRIVLKRTSSERSNFESKRFFNYENFASSFKNLHLTRTFNSQEPSTLKNLQLSRTFISQKPSSLKNLQLITHTDTSLSLLISPTNINIQLTNYIRFLKAYWPFSTVVCKLYIIGIYINAYASVYILVLMTADRYLAVVHPIKSRWRVCLWFGGFWVGFGGFWVGFGGFWAEFERFLMNIFQRSLAFLSYFKRIWF